MLCLCSVSPFALLFLRNVSTPNLALSKEEGGGERLGLNLGTFPTNHRDLLLNLIAAESLCQKELKYLSINHLKEKSQYPHAVIYYVLFKPNRSISCCQNAHHTGMTEWFILGIKW